MGVVDKIIAGSYLLTNPPSRNPKFVEWAQKMLLDHRPAYLLLMIPPPSIFVSLSHRISSTRKT